MVKRALIGPKRERPRREPMSIKLLRHELLGIVLCLMGTERRRCFGRCESKMPTQQSRRRCDQPTALLRPPSGAPHVRDTARLGCRPVPPRSDTSFCQAVMAPLRAARGQQVTRVQWRLATLSEAKAVTTQYHKYLSENSLIKSIPELFASLPALHLASSPSSSPPTNGKRSTVEEQPL